MPNSDNWKISLTSTTWADGTLNVSQSLYSAGGAVSNITVDSNNNKPTGFTLVMAIEGGQNPYTFTFSTNANGNRTVSITDGNGNTSQDVWSAAAATNIWNITLKEPAPGQTDWTWANGALNVNQAKYKGNTVTGLTTETFTNKPTHFVVGSARQGVQYTLVFSTAADGTRTVGISWDDGSVGAAEDGWDATAGGTEEDIPKAASRYATA